MRFSPRSQFEWRLRTRTLPLGRRTLLMGIVNVTPDSFSDGGSFYAVSAAVDHALHLLDEGADVVDLGGESTRPNATAVTAGEEQRRILPVIEALRRRRPEAIVSLDTYHASTARCALGLGVEVINDVSGLLWDEEMAVVLAESGAGAVLMHTRGAPCEWRTMTRLAEEDVLPLVRSGLTHTLALAAQAGVGADHIVLDPGFGFGKRGDENFALHAGLGELHELGRPLLVGTSRKGFLKGPGWAGESGSGAELGAEALAHATSASNTAAILAGAHVLRVHDVRAARAAAAVADAILLRS